MRCQTLKNLPSGQLSMMIRHLDAAATMEDLPQEAMTKRALPNRAVLDEHQGLLGHHRHEV